MSGIVTTALRASGVFIPFVEYISDTTDVYSLCFVLFGSFFFFCRPPFYSIHSFLTKSYFPYSFMRPLAFPRDGEVLLPNGVDPSQLRQGRFPLGACPFAFPPTLKKPWKNSVALLTVYG